MMRKTVRVFLALLLLCILWACRQELEKSEVKAIETDPALTVVAVGDSLTAGMGVAENESYPALLEQRLKSEGYDVRVINAGVSGETTSGTLARLDWVLTLKPDIVILETGANDGLRGLDLGLVRENLKKIVQILREEEITIVFTGMRMVWNLGPVYTSDFNRIYPEIAEENKLIFMPFFLEGVATKSDYNIKDGIHPNQKGYAIIVDNLLPFVKQALVAVENQMRDRQ